MRRRLLDQAVVILLVGAGLATSLPLEAQDIETLARLRGLELPVGYYAVSYTHLTLPTIYSV